MLPIAILFYTREMIIETFSPVLDMLVDKSFHQILKFSAIFMMMRQSHQPFASCIIVPFSTICEYRFPTTKSNPQLLEELVAYEENRSSFS
jgi:hypothetical protein